METKGLKLLKNMCTQWCSLIGPLRRILAEYPALLAKMFEDKDDKKWGMKATVSTPLPTTLIFLWAYCDFLSVARMHEFFCGPIGKFH